MQENKQYLPVAVDAMGGDLGSKVAVEGAVEALSLGVKSILVGDEKELKSYLSDLGIKDEIGVIHAPDVINMMESPSKAIRSKPNASIIRAFSLAHKGEACGLVSAGNTGAMMVAGLFVSRTLPGIDRPAIATLIPRVMGQGSTILLDSGANTECHSFQLVQFALMGVSYAKAIFNIENPTVGLLCNGTEPSKGTDLIRSAYSVLSEQKEVNFIGFVEGKDIVRGKVDIVVCDGFVGNVVLKAMEASAELVIESIKSVANDDFLAKLGLGVAKPAISKLFHEKLDPNAYGGAPLLGLNDIALVCHGSSNARAFKNAILLADKLSKAELVSSLARVLAELEDSREIKNI